MIPIRSSPANRKQTAAASSKNSPAGTGSLQTNLMLTPLRSRWNTAGNAPFVTPPPPSSLRRQVRVATRDDATQTSLPFIQERERDNIATLTSPSRHQGNTSLLPSHYRYECPKDNDFPIVPLHTAIHWVTRGTKLALQHHPTLQQCRHHTCSKCICYVCNVPKAECPLWNDFHCLAHPQDDAWQLYANAALAKMMGMEQDDKDEHQNHTHEKPSTCAIREALQHKTVAQLQHQLRGNDMPVSGGTKAQLMNRILDAMTHGLLDTTCPNCHQGRLKLLELHDHKSTTTFLPQLVYCAGFWNGHTWDASSCDFVCLASKAPRRGQWIKQEEPGVAVAIHATTASGRSKRGATAASRGNRTARREVTAANTTSLPTTTTTTTTSVSPAAFQQQYGNLKTTQLKAILHKNGQHVTGTKQQLLARIYDGLQYGRLGHCPKCHYGRLKVHHAKEEDDDDDDDERMVVFCPGFFDKATSTTVPCPETFECTPEQAPRCGSFQIE